MRRVGYIQQFCAVPVMFDPVLSAQLFELKTITLELLSQGKSLYYFHKSKSYVDCLSLFEQPIFVDPSPMIGSLISFESRYPIGGDYQVHPISFSNVPATRQGERKASSLLN